MAAEQEQAEEVSPPELTKLPPPVAGSFARWLDPRSPVLSYAGVSLMAVGFGVIAFTWLKVSALVSISLQLPYLASGGLTAIGLVILGAMLVTLAASRRDAARREERLRELSDLMRETAELARRSSPGRTGR